MVELRRVVGGAFDVILGRRLEDTGPVAFEATASHRIGETTLTLGRLRAPDHGEELPLLVLAPSGSEPHGTAVWVHETGKLGLLTPRGEPTAPVGRLLDAGLEVIGVDLLFQGEFLTGISPDTSVGQGRARLVYQGEGLLPWQRSAVYTFGYNPSLFAHRVHDVLSVLQYAYGQGHRPDRVALVGLGRVAGPLAAAARAQVDVPLAAAIDTGGFRFESLDRLDDPMFLPGAVKYGDLPALLALGTQGDLWLAGEGAPPLVVAASRALGRGDRVTVAAGAEAGSAVSWLIARGRNAASTPTVP